MENAEDEVKQETKRDIKQRLYSHPFSASICVVQGNYRLLPFCNVLQVNAVRGVALHVMISPLEYLGGRLYILQMGHNLLTPLLLIVFCKREVIMLP